MARIRTIKPSVARHEDLFRAEIETGLPLRFAWAMFPTVCDREGRFKWRPMDLKCDILPYDQIDFSRVLDAFVTRGFILKYEAAGKVYGCIPTFKAHQSINNRESDSEIPPPSKEDLKRYELANTCGSRQARDADASGTRLVQDQGEGKGREGKGREEKIPPDGGTDENTTIWKLGVSLLTKAGSSESAARSFLGQHAKNGQAPKLAEVIARISLHPVADPKAYIAAAMREGRRSQAGTLGPDEVH